MGNVLSIWFCFQHKHCPFTKLLYINLWLTSRGKDENNVMLKVKFEKTTM